jgi:hypothetical protein
MVMPDLIRHPETQDVETALDSGSSPAQDVETALDSGSSPE